MLPRPWRRTARLVGRCPDIDARHLTLHAIYVPSGTAAITIADPTLDTGTSTAVPLFAESAARIDVVLDRVTAQTPSTFVVRLRTGDSRRGSHSHFEAGPPSAFPAIGSARTVVLLHSSVSQSVAATSATCHATADLATGVLLADTCP